MAGIRERVETGLAGRYRIVGELGGGANAAYLAEDRVGARFLVQALQPDSSLALRRKSFLRALEPAARLRHPHILPLLHWGIEDGLVYFVSPHVEGEILRDRLEREKQLAVEDALRIARDVARGLNHGHEHGIIHGLVRPENVLVTPRGSAVTGFGIGSAIIGARRVGSTVLAELPFYTSPEQADPLGEVDGRSDLYALGCVLHEMLTGEPPYTGNTQTIILSQHKGAPIPDLGASRSEVGPGVRVALQRALAKAPADRHSGAAAFALSLEEEMAARPDIPLPPDLAPLAPPRAPLGKRGTLARWIVAVLLAIAVVIALRFLIG